MPPRFAACIDHVDQFDALCLGIAASEARHMDPQHRLLLLSVAETIVMAAAGGLGKGASRLHRPTYKVLLVKGLAPTDTSKSISTCFERRLML